MAGLQAKIKTGASWRAGLALKGAAAGTWEAAFPLCCLHRGLEEGFGACSTASCRGLLQGYEGALPCQLSLPPTCLVTLDTLGLWVSVIWRSPALNSGRKLVRRKGLEKRRISMLHCEKSPVHQLWDLGASHVPSWVLHR